MKGIILAGGSGTRLYPITKGISKQLMPIYDKPMIYYPLSVLLLSGIREILIITTREDSEQFKRLLGDGSEIGCSINYSIQEEPRGLAEAFIIGESFIGNDKVALILGDNIFYGNGLSKILQSFVNIEGGGIFAYEVLDPERYGVVEFINDKVISIEEKPSFPKSKYAIPGIYFYDNNVVEIAKNIEVSIRGEIEITDINKEYLKAGKLHVNILPRGIAWLDTGTFESLANACEFVRIVEQRQSQKIGCIEEIAFRMGFINERQLLFLAEKYHKSGYGKYLSSII